MKGKSYHATTPAPWDAIKGRKCFIIRPDGTASSRIPYIVLNHIVKPGRESFVLNNPATGKIKRSKMIFVID